MKRMLTLLSVLAIASGAVAQEVVTSVNIVGYQKHTFERGKLYMISSQWQNIDGSPVVISDIIGDQAPIASEIFLWNPLKEGGPGYDADQKTFLGWGDGFSIPAGNGFWFRIPDTAAEASYEVAVLGEVPTADSYENVIYSGLTMIAYPYTADVEFSSTALHAASQVGDELIVWDPDKDGTGGYSDNFQKNFLGWGDADTYVLKQGMGYWYRAGAQTAYTETRPYLND